MANVAPVNNGTNMQSVLADFQQKQAENRAFQVALGEEAVATQLTNMLVNQAVNNAKGLKDIGETGTQV